jgi:integrase
MRLRLVGGGTSRDGEAGGGQEVEIVLKIRVSVSEIGLLGGLIHGQIGSMSTAVRSPAGQDGPSSSSPVVGRIDASRSSAGITIGLALQQLEEDMLQAEREPTHVERTLAAVRDVCSARGWTRPDEIDAAGVTAWLGSMRRENGPKTRNLKRSYISRFCEFCRRRGWIASNPVAAVGTARVVRRRARIVPTEAQVAALVESVRGVRRKKDRWLVYLAAATTGLRHGTLKALEWSHVREQEDPPRLDIPGHLLKGREPAIVWLTQELTTLLAAHRAQAKGRKRVFQAVPKWDHMLGDLARAGILQKDESGATLTFHSFRHFASNRMAWSGGFTDQERSRQNTHASVGMTRNVYTDPQAVELGKKVFSLPPLSSGFVGNVLPARPEKVDVGAERGPNQGVTPMPRSSPQLDREAPDGRPNAARCHDLSQGGRLELPGPDCAAMASQPGGASPFKVGVSGFEPQDLEGEALTDWALDSLAACLGLLRATRARLRASAAEGVRRDDPRSQLFRVDLPGPGPGQPADRHPGEPPASRTP